MTAKVIEFRKPRHRTFAEQRAAAIDAQVRRHMAEAFRHNRDAGVLTVWLDDSTSGSEHLLFNLQSQERVYL